MTRRLLVPIDDTPLADRLVELALAYATEHGRELCFVHVEPDPGAGAEAALLHSLAPTLFARHAAGRAPVLLARAEAAARAAGVAHRALVGRGDRPAETILQVAAEQDCEMVFIASHGRRGLEGVRLGSVTRRLLQQARLPVLVAAIEANLPMTAEARALALLRAEHRSLGAVLHGLQHAWHSARSQGRPPDHRLLRAMLYYIAEFPEKLHHPKEEDQLFRRLRQHSGEHQALLDELCAHHRAGAATFAALREALGAAERGEPDGAERFEAALTRFAQSQWAHMAAEERCILPAASAHFGPHDWEAVAEAFGQNGDPRFGAEAETGFEALFDRVLRLAAAADIDTRRHHD